MCGTFHQCWGPVTFFHFSFKLLKYTNILTPRSVWITASNITFPSLIDYLFNNLASKPDNLLRKENNPCHKTTLNKLISTHRNSGILKTSFHWHSRVRLSDMLFSETILAFLLLYSCKQQVLLWQQQIFRTSNLVWSKQQLVLIFLYKQLELGNYKLKIPSLSTLILIEQYIFLLSHIKIYSVDYLFGTFRLGTIRQYSPRNAPLLYLSFKKYALFCLCRIFWSL